MSRYRTRSWRAFEPAAAQFSAALTVRVLGLDPGSRRTGFGVIECRGGELIAVAHGCLNLAAAAPVARLRMIFEGLRALMSQHQPAEVAVERVFVSRNADSALKLGQARGAALCAIPEAVPVFGYAPRAFHLPAVGEEVRLLTHLVVREDAHVLYGFATEDERRLFRSLIKVSGVGPKIALALLSGISVGAFARCVLDEDIGTLTRVPGVGRKTAERLIVEMRDRLAAPQETPGAPLAAASAAGEAYGALVALGYRPAEAARLLKAVGPGTHSTEELIRRALQGAAREQISYPSQ